MMWQPIETAPKDGTEVDLWVSVYASPMSMGFSDAWRVTNARWINGKGWCDIQKLQWEKLRQDIITHWMPVPLPPETDPNLTQPQLVSGGNT